MAGHGYTACKYTYELTGTTGTVYFSTNSLTETTLSVLLNGVITTDTSVTETISLKVSLANSHAASTETQFDITGTVYH